MFRVITVPATGTDSDQPVFETALAMARLDGAQLGFLHVQADVNTAIAAMMAASDGMATGVEKIARDLERDVAERRQLAEQAFHDFCRLHALPERAEPGTARLSARLFVETGYEYHWLAEYGRTTDLIVLGRAREEVNVATDVLEAALMTTGRPILITPPQAADGMAETIVIGWKNRREAARAVEAARPCIALARRVVVMTVDEDDAADQASCDRLCETLRWHNPHVEAIRIQRDGRPPVEALQRAAAAEGAGLLVVGGYGHSRLREMVFGGFTRRLLEAADIPVLMAH